VGGFLISLWLMGGLGVRERPYQDYKKIELELGVENMGLERDGIGYSILRLRRLFIREGHRMG
jgi:hypothetical protein